MLTIVMPTYKRPGTAYRHLEQLNYQTLKEFEVVVVHDGPYDMEYDVPDVRYPLKVLATDEKLGPGHARNVGIEHASHDIILIVGDDCEPDRNLTMNHLAAHWGLGRPAVVQGYSPFHPSVMDTPFMVYLDASGLQANWKALKDKEGKWLAKGGGFFLTTNVSMHKSVLEAVGAFDTIFPSAAWEDIELGYRIQSAGIETDVFPQAINFHRHKYTLPEFAHRQNMEGRNRVIICTLHSEMSPSLMPLGDIRQAMGHSMAEWLKIGQSVSGVHNGIPNAQTMKYDTWSQVLRMASLQGILASLNERGLPYSAFPYLKDQETLVISLDAMRELGNDGHTRHCATWIFEKERDNGYANGIAAWLLAYTGDKNAAMDRYQTALGLLARDARKGKAIEDMVDAHRILRS